MPSSHSPADDIVYDLVSIQYHALQAADLYEKYIQDAREHEEVVAFIRRCQEQDSERAMRCHQLLGELTSGGDLSAS